MIYSSFKILVYVYHRLLIKTFAFLGCSLSRRLEETCPKSTLVTRISKSDRNWWFITTYRTRFCISLQKMTMKTNKPLFLPWWNEHVSKNNFHTSEKVQYKQPTLSYIMNEESKMWEWMLFYIHIALTV